MKGFVVAGTASGVGKTTITAGLLAALRARGLTVQPFKCGPDYIDPAHHTVLAARASYNLDTWMLPTATNLSIFGQAMRDADVALVEGVMGLFDGVNGRSDEGSTAEIAKLLGLPVVLVVDASNAARSVAAVVKGFAEFDPQIRLLGVILNGAVAPGHVNLLREAIAPIGVPVLGCFPKLPELGLQERHLGLVTAGEKTWNAEQVQLLIGAVESNIELDRLLAGCEISARGEQPKEAFRHRSGERNGGVHIGIARDRAFSFYYQSSLDALRAAGADLVEVSPLSDASLPADLDGLYLGGGYPEVFAEELAQNHSFLDSVRKFAATGHPIYGECGGLMYLADDLQTLDGRHHAMASVLPLSIEMLDRLDGFGYTEVQVQDDCLLGARGARMRGHSFHYSRVTQTGDVRLQYHTRRALSGTEEYEGYSAGSVLASYVHLSFAGSPEATAQFTRRCRQAKVAQEAMR
ncbi:MAG: cobyrinate a,c-diamide synthase [Candidatus Korobacteraceae bacterium]